MNDRTENLLLFALQASVAFVITAAAYFMLIHLISLEPFGHDEAVYLTQARSWSEGTPAEQWEIYRPIAMSVYAWFIFFIDNSLITMRMFGVIFGAFAAGVIFLFYRKLTNLWIALSTTSVIATSTLFLKQAPLFRNDVPSSALLVAVLWLIYIHYKSGGKSNSIYLVAPLAALAFYTRYAVATTLAVIAVFTCAFMLQRFMRQENHDFKKIWWTILLAAGLFVPFFIVSKFIMGNFLGILQYAGSAAHPPAYIGEGLIQYIHWIPNEIGGLPLSVTVIMGAVATLILVSIQRLREEYFQIAWIGSIGLTSFIVTALLTHADPRYIFFPLVLLSGTGIASAYYALSYWSDNAAIAAAALAMAVTIYLGIGLYRDVGIFYAQRALSPTTMAYAEVYDAINADAAGHACAIWLTEYLPKASWYTRCSVYSVTDPGKFRHDAAKHPDNINYSVVFTKLQDTQIKEDSRERFNVGLTEIFKSFKLSSGDLIIYRIDKNATTSPATTTTLQ